MVARRTRSRSKSASWRFLSKLSSACSEWCLIILLFVNAALSYLATKFARFCKLQSPCFLCSRIDHIVGNKEPWFCGDLVCGAHKSQISCLAYCRSHQKLAFVHDLCESCFLSSLKQFASIDADASQSTFEGEDLAKVPLLKTDADTRLCSCCSSPFRRKSHVRRLLKEKEIEAKTESGINPRERSSERREISLGQTHIYHSDVHGFDHLSHIGYSELKITSDSESEVPISEDDDDRSSLHRGGNDIKQEKMDRDRKSQPVISINKSLSPPVCEDVIKEKLIHPTPVMPVDAAASNSTKQPNVVIGHGLEEIIWSQVNVRTDLAASVPEHVPAEVLKEKYIEETGDSEQVLSTTNGDVTKVSTLTGLKKHVNSSEPCPSIRIFADKSDSMKRALSNKGALLSPKPSEIISARENSSRTHEDLKLLISQISSSRGLDLPWTEMSPSPRLSMQGDESKLSDASSSTGIQNTNKRSSMERNYSGLESYDVSVVSEVEGESSIDRLKRQIEFDRKSMSILYKELEEERSASAVAASEAMAMINRLQEEKAAMQMEALQYLRMMEEQAEYDQEAIQKLNDVLTEREKDILDLEAELESYKKRFGDEMLEDKVIEQPLHGSDEREYNTNNIPCSIISGLQSTADKDHKMFKDSNGFTFEKDPSLGFEDEKAYILECLRKLEKKLCLFSSNAAYDNEPGDDGKRTSQLANNYRKENGALVNDTTMNGGDSISENSDWNKENSENGRSEGEVESHSSLSREQSNGEEIFLTSSQNKEIAEENHKGSSPCSNSENGAINVSSNKMSDITVLKEEVAQLNDRFTAIEADQKFLQHTINSLKNGNGVEFISEITSHLRELRRMVSAGREQAVA
ncbi:probable myosin-binding protein 4 isoform X2 [Ananas comosus]|uniref:Probable myosin-binding protein 4 isoform X2 n=1 Tax=Ananas comosus TaxID=4615 RepID=A0A6P5GGX1_ANACO|nr:probable myosin-binding protein 4 isoform X2 [Ananas comosus]